MANVLDVLIVFSRRNARAIDFRGYGAMARGRRKDKRRGRHKYATSIELILDEEIYLVNYYGSGFAAQSKHTMALDRPGFLWSLKACLWNL